MSLTLRPTGLSSPVHKDAEDYTVFSGAWAIGRIYDDGSTRPELHWYWSLFGPHAPLDVMQKEGREPTLHAAKLRLKEQWDKWLAWASLMERS
jgi:hypothetical protein